MLYPVQVESGSLSQAKLAGKSNLSPLPAGDGLGLRLEADEECEESAILVAPPCSFTPSRDRDSGSDTAERSRSSPGGEVPWVSPHSPHKDFHYAVLRALSTNRQMEVESSKSPGTGELLSACLVSSSCPTGATVCGARVCSPPPPQPHRLLCLSSPSNPVTHPHPNPTWVLSFPTPFSASSK